MSEKQGTTMFNFYTDALKSWQNAFGPWSDYMKNFGKSEKSSESGSFSAGSFFDFSSAAKNSIEMMKKLPIPFNVIKAMNGSLAKGIDSSREMFEKMVECVNKNFRAGCEISSSFINGDEIETDRMFTTASDSWNQMSECFSKSLNDTPFEKIKDVINAVKNSMDSFSGERKMTQNLMKEITAFNFRMAKLTSSCSKELVNFAAECKDRKPMSLDTVKQIIQEHGLLMSRTLSILDLPKSVQSEYNDRISRYTDLAERYIEAVKSGIEINLKSQQAVSTSAGEIISSAGGAFKMENVLSQEEFFKKWAEMTENTTRKIMEKAELEVTIPKFIETCADCFKSTTDEYRNAMEKRFAVSPAVMESHDSSDKKSRSKAKKEEQIQA